MDLIIGIIIGVAAFAVGAVLSFFLWDHILVKKKNKIVSEAKTEAEVIKKEKELAAKEKFLQLKAENDKNFNEKNQKIAVAENRIKQKEANITTKLEELQRSKKENETLRENLNKQIELAEKKAEELDKAHKAQVEKLESLSGLSSEQAKKELIESMQENAKAEAITLINDIIDEAKMTANKEAKRIILETIQRVATETAIENAVTVFHIESDELKGRIIGREGRNIRALEAATGVEIVVDDTPEAILLSAFDPVRREIARLSLHQLVTDGRIHPARIEEVVNKTTKQIEEEIIEVGKRTSIDLGVHNLHPELIRLIGKMKYRSSYGQNLLQHSREVANLCAIMAAELGLNTKLAKRAGLLHDIGKVSDEEPELPHAIYAQLCVGKFASTFAGDLHQKLDGLLVVIDIVDAYGTAKKSSYQSYIKRLKDLENLALSYPSVVKTYAIQAGRELRVIVGSEKITDAESEQLSLEIARRVQDEMTYPGQVKITVIRETRSVNYAK